MKKIALILFCTMAIVVSPIQADCNLHQKSYNTKYKVGVLRPKKALNIIVNLRRKALTLLGIRGKNIYICRTDKDLQALFNTYVNKRSN